MYDEIGYRDASAKFPKQSVDRADANDSRYDMYQMNDENNEMNTSNLLDQSFKSKITQNQAPRFYNDTSQHDVSRIDIQDDSHSQVD